ncbi:MULTISPECIES: ATP-binding protein [unclassified Kitasatospora]|uniref:ATP-binding protein n=1 Tax=unclassified Kitasatospora TaxID=2633591 RepID=UPI00070D65E5|nr:MULTISPECIES: ATP-binding protein [unclassified Kitasatospora]KQV20894.1 ATP-binding protein [Kitasatospora sp. Root107]KRB60452.1 ATP-binding protein [Kitasatospora sp. Root187]
MIDPQPLGGAIARILRRRGLDPAAVARTEIPEPQLRLQALDAAAARIPARYQDALADHPEVIAWADEVRRAARPGPGGQPGIAKATSLLLAGPTGTGKTHQAYGALRLLLADGVRLRWRATTSADLHALLRPRPGHDGERDFQELLRVPLLLVDDLGAGKSSEFTEEVTWRLINHRYNEQLPTMLTTNLATAQLREVLGERVSSRLREMSRHVRLTGPDRRRPPTAA